MTANVHRVCSQELSGDAHLIAEASDESTLPTRLRELAAQHFRQENSVHDALASNPSTPPDVLFTLADLAPAALLRNPILPLLPLEIPDFAAIAPTSLRRALLSRADTPRNLLQQIVIGKAATEVRSEARLHVRFHGELPDDRWKADAERVLRRAARRLHKESVRSTAFELCELGLAPNWLVNEKPLIDPLDRDAELLALINGDFMPDSLHVVGSDGALALLLDCVDPRVELSMEEPEEHEEQADLIGGTPDSDLSISAPSTFINLHLLLQRQASGAWSKWDHRETQWILAYHPNTPVDCLRALAGNAESHLRRVACRHPNAPEGIQEFCRQALLGSVTPEERSLPWVLRLFLLLARPETLEAREYQALELAKDATNWRHRLAGVLALPLSPTGFATLERLASEEGNCLVRAAVRARLRGEMLDLNI